MTDSQWRHYANGFTAVVSLQVILECLNAVCPNGGWTTNSLTWLANLPLTVFLLVLLWLPHHRWSPQFVPSIVPSALRGQFATAALVAVGLTLRFTLFIAPSHLRH